MDVVESIWLGEWLGERLREWILSDMENVAGLAITLATRSKTEESTDSPWLGHDRRGLVFTRVAW